MENGIRVEFGPHPVDCPDGPTGSENAWFVRRGDEELAHFFSEITARYIASLEARRHA